MHSNAVGDYNGHMILNLRESKARLSELVESASRGEDILITVSGKIRARLTRATGAEPASMKSWAEELSERLARQKPIDGSMLETLNLDREEREL